jgi:citronellol/citronellal dehydrogenase
MLLPAARARSASLADYGQFHSSVRGSLKGQTLFVSGASRGIGLAIALRAAREGANIIVAAKTTEAQPNLPGTIYTAAAEIEKAGGKALAVVCDIRSEESVRAAVEAGVKKFGGIDILINKSD